VIGSLRGVLVDRALGGEALVEVAGVGYRVTVAAGTAAHLGATGTETFLWIHHHFRDDHQALYGFASRQERDCFELLLGAHGVGPAMALAILSVHPPFELGRILADDDLAALCLVPGVGKKTAARLSVELKARLLDDDGALVLAGGAGLVGGAANNGNGSTNGNAAGGGSTDGNGRASGGGPGTAPDGPAPSPRSVVRQALAELGYGPEEARRALTALDDDEALVGADESTLLRAALRRMGR
jgi:Holliday junction DNA helicase RuvA